ncbi:1-aminocyclopropane-1-carboxylate deaminase/D-cysteine desulfhydrase [Streptomyces sp. INA 01156]
MLAPDGRRPPHPALNSPAGRQWPGDQPGHPRPRIRRPFRRPRCPHGPRGPAPPPALAGAGHRGRAVRAARVRLLLKRDDLIHPELIGNKWRKLAPNLAAAACRTVLTFGGAYSNHLRATAAACCSVCARSAWCEARSSPTAPNPSLARCAADGMRLHFVDRATYRRKTASDTLAAVLRAAGAEDAYVVPEGGSTPLAVRGCRALGEELGRADVVAVACGTGGTLAGLAAGLGSGTRALGVPVLKGGFLATDVRALQAEAFGGPRGDWSLDDRFHFGGYARTAPALEEFAADFERRHGVPVERVYVAKLLYALVSLAEENAFPRGARSRRSSPAAPSREHVTTGARWQTGSSISSSTSRCDTRGLRQRTVRPCDVWVRQSGARSSLSGPQTPSHGAYPWLYYE